MAAQTSIAPDVPDPSDSALIFHKLDAELNSVILYSLLHGIYTGIAVVTLGNMICEDNTVSPLLNWLSRAMQLWTNPNPPDES
ncbi:hypothetical protein F5146DRAFT_1144362 [Armillaria mellea]|nr:hypothetical protein F5146DRAFT_1144362 [Armillaria mellea]